jgi:hypothetical protein
MGLSVSVYFPSCESSFLPSAVHQNGRNSELFKNSGSCILSVAGHLLPHSLPLSPRVMISHIFLFVTILGEYQGKSRRERLHLSLLRSREIKTLCLSRRRIETDAVSCVGRGGDDQ